MTALVAAAAVVIQMRLVTAKAAKNIRTKDLKNLLRNQ